MTAVLVLMVVLLLPPAAPLRRLAQLGGACLDSAIVAAGLAAARAGRRLTALPAASAKDTVVGALLLLLLPLALRADYAIVLSNARLVLPAQEAATWFALSLVALGAASGLVESHVSRFFGLLLGGLVLLVQVILAYAKQQAVILALATVGRPVPLPSLQVALAVCGQAVAVVGALTLASLGGKLALNGLLQLAAQLLRLPLRLVAWAGGVLAARPLSEMLPAATDLLWPLKQWLAGVAASLQSRLRRPVPPSPLAKAHEEHELRLVTAQQQFEREELDLDLGAKRASSAARRQAEGEVDAATRQSYLAGAAAAAATGQKEALPLLLAATLEAVRQADWRAVVWEFLPACVQRHPRQRVSAPAPVAAPELPAPESNGVLRSS